MTFKMYKYTGEGDVINKSITHVADLTGYFKDDTELINPTLILAPGYTVTTENYFLINGLYYFVTGVIYSQQNLQVSLDLDDLESYKTDILNQTAILERSSTKDTFNLYQEDPDIPVLKCEEVTMSLFPGSFDGESLILVVAGGTPSP